MAELYYELGWNGFNNFLFFSFLAKGSKKLQVGFKPGRGREHTDGKTLSWVDS